LFKGLWEGKWEGREVDFGFGGTKTQEGKEKESGS